VTVGKFSIIALYGVKTAPCSADKREYLSKNMEDNL
jgi:hypothetical protein